MGCLASVPARAANWVYSSDDIYWRVLRNMDSIRNVGEGAYEVDVFALSFRRDNFSRSVRLRVFCPQTLRSGKYQRPGYSVQRWQLFDQNGKAVRSGPGGAGSEWLAEIGFFEGEYSPTNLFSGIYLYVCPGENSGFSPTYPIRESFPFPNLQRQATSEAIGRAGKSVVNAFANIDFPVTIRLPGNGGQYFVPKKITVEGCDAVFTLDSGRQLRIQHRAGLGVSLRELDGTYRLGVRNAYLEFVTEKEPGDTVNPFIAVQRQYEAFARMC
ncbi:hypothetical protein [Erythrobacter sp. SG61-1L]|uniref:hypothetical protein n=1 Tax=Erythrobacter sp. SG61-1L TaxID=1603897 RepID=UPI0012E27C60|nr:hypothetical protein [Erythrobacter sp. SG61-1L]